MIRRFDGIRAQLEAKGFPPAKVEEFIAWDHANQWVWQAICNRFNDLYRQGMRSIGMKKIFEDLRVDNRYKGLDGFKLKNDWTSYYGHALSIVCPKVRGILRLKEIKKDAAFYLNRQAA